MLIAQPTSVENLRFKWPLPFVACFLAVLNKWNSSCDNIDTRYKCMMKSYLDHSAHFIRKFRLTHYYYISDKVYEEMISLFRCRSLSLVKGVNTTCAAGESRRMSSVAVIGAGVIGLSTAVCVQVLKHTAL